MAIKPPALILYTYLTKSYIYYFALFLCVVLGVVSLFESLDFVQKDLAHTAADPFVIVHRSVRHVYQFFPYLLFAVFAYAMRMIVQKHEFRTLQYLGFGQSIWLKLGVLLACGFSILFYFILTPVQRVALQRSQKPVNAIQSTLVAPTGIWFLDKSPGGATRFIKAAEYDQETQRLKDVHVFIAPSLAVHDVSFHFEKWMFTPANTLMNSAQDYFPYLNTPNKIETLKRMGFSALDYRLIQHRVWFLPLYFFGLALLAFLLVHIIQRAVYFFLVIFGTTIALFFMHEMAMSFVMAEKVALVPMLASILAGLYLICGGCYVAFMRFR
jgi:lipopolysaccharide export LptBFGC system permease protein LptF